PYILIPPTRLKFKPIYRKSRTNSATGRLDEAIAHFKQSITIDPEFEEGYDALRQAIAKKKGSL
ncbi:hypothetical protein, partial [Arthrospira sp. PCC 8006]|uniref:hypothetical protein n=1 Tax=Arthrospira sp. PCC 8006 TaxID=1982224 RepID=UPI00396F2E8C